VVTKVLSLKLIFTQEIYSVKQKIIKSIKALAATGKFDPEKINPKPTPNVTTEELTMWIYYFELTKLATKISMEELTKAEEKIMMIILEAEKSICERYYSRASG